MTRYHAEEIVTGDGRVTIKRTRGRLSVECHGEPVNGLAIDLAHELFEGDNTVEEARGRDAKIYARMEAGGDPGPITDL